MKATEQYFYVVLLIMLYKVVLTFEFEDEILKCDHSNESYRAVLLCGTVNYFFLKHFSGPESGILEFDWLLTRVPPVQFFPIRTGFVMDH